MRKAAIRAGPPRTKELAWCPVSYNMENLNPSQTCMKAKAVKFLGENQEVNLHKL